MLMALYQHSGYRGKNLLSNELQYLAILREWYYNPYMSKKLTIYKSAPTNTHTSAKTKKTPKKVVKTATVKTKKSGLVGKPVIFNHRGQPVAGVVSKESGGRCKIFLAAPVTGKTLLYGESVVKVPTEKLEEISAPTRKAKFMPWETTAPLQVKEGKKGKKMVAIRDEANNISDYLDVTVSGFASTFENVTGADRDGDRVQKDAFEDGLTDFLKNPVMLYDHVQSANNIAGSYSNLRVTDAGLAVEGVMSNAPDIKSLRFKVVEGHLRAFSIGGLFVFDPEDLFLITKVYLLEISLVAIPANQDALFIPKYAPKSLSADSAAKLLRVGQRNGFSITR